LIGAAGYQQDRTAEVTGDFGVDVELDGRAPLLKIGTDAEHEITLFFNTLNFSMILSSISSSRPSAIMLEDSCR
jgi:hypothetical protein